MKSLKKEDVKDEGEKLVKNEDDKEVTLEASEGPDKEDDAALKDLISGAEGK